MVIRSFYWKKPNVAHIEFVGFGKPTHYGTIFVQICYFFFNHLRCNTKQALNHCLSCYEHHTNVFCVRLVNNYSGKTHKRTRVFITEKDWKRVDFFSETYPIDIFILSAELLRETDHAQSKAPIKQAPTPYFWAKLMNKGRRFKGSLR